MSTFPSPTQTTPDEGKNRPSRGARWLRGRSPAEKLVRKNTLLYSLWLGVAAGLTFSISLWAYEAILFFGAHVAYPWMPFVVGTILCVLVCASAALLTNLVDKAILGILFWVVAGGLIAGIAITLPLKIVPALMKFFEPGLRGVLPAYPITDTFRTWAGFGTIWLGIFFAILGLLQLTLVEQAVPAGSAAGRLVPYFVFVPVMALASVMSSNMISSQLRAPLLSMDKLIQFAVDNQNTTVDPDLARQMHMSTLRTIPDLIDRPRRLFLGTYDDSYWEVEILVDFDGEWANCTTVTGQPVFCEPLADQ